MVDPTLIIIGKKDRSLFAAARIQTQDAPIAGVCDVEVVLFFVVVHLAGNAGDPPDFAFDVAKDFTVGVIIFAGAVVSLEVIAVDGAVAAKNPVRILPP